jgi:hypothetical protein
LGRVTLDWLLIQKDLACQSISLVERLRMIMAAQSIDAATINFMFMGR